MSTENIIINGVEINLDQVYALIAENRKLDAIKYVVDHTKTSLLEAKNLVDDLSSNKRINTVDMDMLEQVKNLLKQNKKIEAVKFVKSMTGLGLKESKDLVENLDHLSSDQLFENYKGTSAEKFADKKKWASTYKDKKKSTLYVDETSGKTKKVIIFLFIVIAAVIYYFYQK